MRKLMHALCLTGAACRFIGWSLIPVALSVNTDRLMLVLDDGAVVIQ